MTRKNIEIEKGKGKRQRKMKKRGEQRKDERWRMTIHF